jgi:hypothetical protein
MAESCKYSVETDQGNFEVELDREVPDTPEGHALLQRLVADQLRYQQASQNTAGAFLKQTLGGIRDAGQQVLDLPAEILNAVTEFVSPDVPGGPRRRVLSAVHSPQIPSPPPPQTWEEYVTRVLANIGTNLALTPALPGVRRWLKSPPGGPLMFEPGRAVSRSAPSGWQRVPTMAAPSGPLLTELSDGARATARLLGLPDNVGQIAQLSQAQAAQALGVLRQAAAGDPALLADASTPLGALFATIQQRLLSFR